MDSLESKELASISKVMENNEKASENDKITGIPTEEEEEEVVPVKKKRTEEGGGEIKEVACEKETVQREKCQDKNTCRCCKSISFSATYISLFCTICFLGKSELSFY